MTIPIAEKEIDATGHEYIKIVGACEHNLKNIDVAIPRNELVVITGVSGSGKSSLAFDTIYAEGQRRYMESFSAYARNFIGSLKRPEVEKISGLSPVISIEQKTTSRNPRSTVGTTTEIYDFLRLLYARVGEAFSYESGKRMSRQSEDQIINTIINAMEGKILTLLAPVVKGRKGNYKQLFVQIRKNGYNQVRVDGEIVDLKPKMQLDRFKIHDIEVVIDRIRVSRKDRNRIYWSIKTAMKEGRGMLLAMEQDGTIHRYSKHLTDSETGLSYDDPAPNTFSFNSPYGACPTCKGLGTLDQITEESIIPDKELSISQGAILPLGEYRDIWVYGKIQDILEKDGCALTDPIKDIPANTLSEILYGKKVDKKEEEQEDPNIDSIKDWDIPYDLQFNGIINFLEKHQQGGWMNSVKKWIEEFITTTTCPECNGDRLKKESLHIKIGGTNISQLARLNMRALKTRFDNLNNLLNERQKIIAKDILKEIQKRIGFLLDIGLDYLSLDRSLRTLSGGEVQRIRLATQIGTQLVNVLYILDEPSIGLHARDNIKLIEALKNLRDMGNSVIVVEHDKEMMLKADYIIDLGPGAGKHGGYVVAKGKPEDFLKNDSITTQYLTKKRSISNIKKRRKSTGKTLYLEGAKGHNLKNVNITLPLGTLTCVTGVSGSGKSSLIHKTLFPVLSTFFSGNKKHSLPHKKISGMENLNKIIEVSQSPIGRTPRSNPATYTKVFSDIRHLYAQLPESKIRGYKLGRFSFNVKGGRCETCKGAGLRLIEMDFLPDVHVQCETCKGMRYNRETLEVRFKNKSILDVLNMTVEEATIFFKNQPHIAQKIQTLNEVGLGYIALGQYATTLSGGEAQRVKLATELSKKDTGKTLYILDEPTTGLHFQDISHLLKILQKLVDKGNTVLVIEHNMEVIKSADYIIDLGPEGGDKGGEMMISGTPEEVAQSHKGYTSQYLRAELKPPLITSTQSVMD